MEESSETTVNHDDSILSDGWQKILVENDRLYYVHETKRLCCLLPPKYSWESRRGLPYGWEMARSSDGRRYYINHLTKDTARSLPSVDSEPSLPPRTRTVVISRHSDIGFGFVAGSEKPVLIRSVAEDGPSAGKLHANDQILKINGEDVHDLPQSEVILRIKQYNEELCLEVISNDDVQDVKNQGQKKSSIMSRATRERRRSNPVSVRFAETPVLVQYGGSPPSIPLRRSSLPLIPNALKIFLENGQTRSFLYTPETTAKELFLSLGEKIGLKTLDRFSLVLQSTQGSSDSFVLFSELASQIYTRRNCSSSTWLCKLLLVFAPKDINHFLKEDPIAFEYFYKQMCSQVVEGRWEIKYETAIKLAALQLQQYALEDKAGKTGNGKISVKAIEKEVGSLETFVPGALINTMQKKDLQRILAQQIKQTRNLSPPGQKYISPLQAKLQYLKICSEMKMYGGRQFNAVIVDSTEDQKLFADQKLSSVIFVGPNVGLSKVTNPRSFAMEQIADFNQIIGLVVTPHTEGKQNLKIFLTNEKSVTLILGPIFETRDLVYIISGYHKFLVENANSLSIMDLTTSGNVAEASDEVPSYSNKHRVVPDTWSYKEEDNEGLKDVDLRQKPNFQESEMYSEINGNESLKESVKHPVCNGFIKTNLRSPDVERTKGSPSLERIQEEPLSPRLHLDHVDGHASARKSFVKLTDDLKSESTDEEPEKTSNTQTTQINTSESCNITHNKTNGIIEVPVVILDETPSTHKVGEKDHSKEIPLENPTCSELLADTHRTLPSSTGTDTTSAVPTISELPHPTPVSPTGSDSTTAVPAIGELPHPTPASPIGTDSMPGVPTINELPHPTLVSHTGTEPSAAVPTISELPHVTSVNPTGTESTPVVPTELPLPTPASPIRTHSTPAVPTELPLPTPASPIGTHSTSAVPSELSANLHPAPDKHGVEISGPIVDQSPASLHKIRVDISLTPSIESSANTSGDESSVLSSPTLSEKPSSTLNKNRRHSEGAVLEESPRKHIQDIANDLRSKGHKQTVKPRDDYALKHNGDVKTERVHRRRSHPSFSTNKNIHPIIVNNSVVDYKTKGIPTRHEHVNEENIKSRAQACDHVLKELYIQKAKLDSLLHWNHPVRTNNEIVGAKRHFMIERVTVLDECIKQLQILTAAEENRIIEIVLRLPYAISLLTESCTMLYNAQYSMRHCSQALMDVINKFIDVLITTDAWDPANVSALNLEIHKDKCDSVHFTLGSLRNIITTL